MLELKAAVLALIVAAGPHMSDAGEDPEQRALRLDTIAEDIARVAHARPYGYEPVAVAAGLLTIGEMEAHWASWVGLGCKGKPPKGVGDCDGGKARSYWQAWEVACKGAWTYARGSWQAQRAFAKCAAKRWLGAWKRCSGVNKDDAIGAFAGYRSTCIWEPRPNSNSKPNRHNSATVRANLFYQRLNKLRVLLAKPKG